MTHELPKLTPIPWEYYGFKMAIGDTVAPVIARAEARDEGGTLWGSWFTNGEPIGLRVILPGGKRLDDAKAQDATQRIVAGEPPPDGLVADFPILGARADWASVS